MKRGEIWTVAGGADYAGKPRPAVIVQDDRFDSTQSITLCPLTTEPTDLPLFRLPLAPSRGNGLRMTSRLMVDKITTVPRSKLGARLGHVSPADMARLNRAMIVFLGIAAAREPRP